MNKHLLQYIKNIIKTVFSPFKELFAFCNTVKQLYKTIKCIESTYSLLETKIVSKGGIIDNIKIINQKLDDLTRHYLLLDLHSPDATKQLLMHRMSIYSQNGEDGIILELIKRIGNPTYKFVEICCGENGGNSGVLAFELGWSGLMVDGNAQRLENLRSNFQFDPQKVTVLNSWVTKENINELIKAGNMAGEIDLLSIDLDGMDYWIWKEINTCKPRIIIVEYNASFGKDRSVTIPYSPKFARPPEFRIYYGASLMALYKLGNEKGYRLIGVEPSGVNAVFIRNDLLKDIYPAKEPQVCYKMLTKHMLYQVKKGYKDFYAELQRLKLPIVEV